MTLKDAVVTRYARAVRSLAALVIEFAMQGRLETIDLIKNFTKSRRTSPISTSEHF